jgi:hypothetical protein
VIIIDLLKDGELHLGCPIFKPLKQHLGREISVRLVQVRGRVVDYLSGVMGPLVYLNALWPAEEGFLPPHFRHNRPNSRRLLLLVEFRRNTIGGKSSTGCMSETPFPIPRSGLRRASDNIDVKSLALEVVSEVILYLSTSMSDSCPLSASSIAVSITRTGESIVSSIARVPTTKSNPSVARGDLIAGLGQSLENARASDIQSNSIGHGILRFGYTAISVPVTASTSLGSCAK